MSDDENGPDWRGYGVAQAVVKQWVRTRFNDKIMDSIDERVRRVAEEAIELMQAESRDKALAREEAHKLVDRVFDNPPGKPEQESGGVIVTMLAYCAARNLRFDKLAGIEITRIMESEPQTSGYKHNLKVDPRIALRPE